MSRSKAQNSNLNISSMMSAKSGFNKEIIGDEIKLMIDKKMHQVHKSYDQLLKDVSSVAQKESVNFIKK